MIELLPPKLSCMSSNFGCSTYEINTYLINEVMFRIFLYSILLMIIGALMIYFLPRVFMLDELPMEEKKK